jgi:hypothetical protein
MTIGSILATTALFLLAGAVFVLAADAWGAR